MTLIDNTHLKAAFFVPLSSSTHRHIIIMEISDEPQ
jgi:hypothetical protein